MQITIFIQRYSKRCSFAKHCKLQQNLVELVWDENKPESLSVYTYYDNVIQCALYPLFVSHITYLFSKNVVFQIVIHSRGQICTIWLSPIWSSCILHILALLDLKYCWSDKVQTFALFNRSVIFQKQFVSEFNSLQWVYSPYDVIICYVL